MKKNSMDKTYEPHSIEQRWYQTWEQNGWFAPASDQGANADAYCIMIPPPNVTGSLHMGHAFQDTIMDALIRYHRMCGDNTLWQPGTDHAGIATQMVVERRLLAEGKTRHELGRERFLDEVWKWKGESGGTITRQLRRMGASPDWSRERFTMDEGLSDAVKEVFVLLYEEGLIYRGKRLVNWDPVLHTAVSDLEVISEEENGYLWHLRYPLSDGSGHLVVATTRPETMLGDSAVAVNPEDERYKHLVGKTLTLPLVGREIPIIADDYVDPEFGTGCVKITPAHDFNDYAVGQRHQLPQINVFTIDAKINDEAPEQYRGLGRYEARDQIVRDLKELELVEKIDDHKLMVPRGDRSHSVIEPLLTDQWYVKVGPLAEEAIKVVEEGRIRFVPDNWKNTYFDWMHKIEDWCISRQIWWGHRIPAWYDQEGNVYVGRDEAEVRDTHKLGFEVKLRQDEDVLDTWFSSALWPFSTLGWPQQSAALKTFYPTSVLVTGFDIIFFWVARMIMMGLKFMGDVPFREVYIHGLVRDAHGQKMSKSKGNVLDPIDLIDGIELETLVQKRTSGLMQPEMAKKIEKQTRAEFPDGIKPYGTDALRFTFASLASTGRDINFDTGRIEGYRNFCNKLWNAARYVLMNTEEKDCGQEGDALELSLADRWILSRLQRTVATANEAIAGYRFDLAAQAIYDFTWNEYCDWYLELSKPVLTRTIHGASPSGDLQSPRFAPGETFTSGNATEADAQGSASAAGGRTPGAAQERGTRRTLVQVLEALLRLAHPIMPYITEEIWQRVAPLAGTLPSPSGRGAGGEGSDAPSSTIMRQPYPQAGDFPADAAAEGEMQWVMDFIVGVRKIRSGMNIAPSKKLPILLQNFSEQDRARYEETATFSVALARLESVDFLGSEVEAPESATALVGEMKVLVPMAGLIDKEAELARLGRELGKLEKDIERVQAKLGNDSFTAKAPPELVQREHNRLAELQTALAQLSEQKAKIERL